MKIKSGPLDIGESWQNDWPRREFSVLYPELWGERPMADEIRRIAQSKYVVDFMGKTNLLELIALEKMAAVHVSSDTGPLHIANAVGTPIIALFGPTPPYRNGPYGNRYSEVLLAENPGHGVTNMGTISVEAVYDSCMKKLSL